VNGSFRTATPATAATAGFMYVKASPRTGPASAMRAKKSRNATEVQTTESPATEAITRPEGTSVGRLHHAIGTYAIADRASAVAGTPRGGRSLRNAA
jgi:hypothetical protein